MLDDTSDELLGGFWPFLKRILFLLLPFWVYLLCISANLPMIVSTILAGSSLAVIVAFEKLKLSRDSSHSEDGESL